jgi:hypothetical protein
MPCSTWMCEKGHVSFRLFSLTSSISIEPETMYLLMHSFITSLQQSQVQSYPTIYKLGRRLISALLWV